MNYHLIDGKAFSIDAFGGIYAVTQNNFEHQMSLLKDFNIKVASLSDIVDNNVKEEFSVALTFDDGNPSDFDIVFPILLKYGFPATFFLSIQNVEKNGVIWEKYIQMVKKGFDIGSHGIYHKDLSIIEPSEIRTELEQSKLIIERNVNESIRFFSLPYGMYNSKVIKQAKILGFDAILSTQFNFVNPSEKSFVLGRWNIKRNTSIKDFILIIKNHRFTVKKYKYISKVKKYIMDFLGSSLINKVNTLKNRY